MTENIAEIWNIIDREVSIGVPAPRGTFCHYVGLVGGCPLTTKWDMPRPESVVLLRYRGSKVRFTEKLYTKTEKRLCQFKEL